MREQVREYTYFATRMGNLVIIRKTLNGLKKIKSRFHNATKQLDIVQVTYTGGTILGTMLVKEWQWTGNRAIAEGGYLKLTRSEARGLKPYLR